MGVPALSRAVFLDRDGVLNRAVVKDGKPHPPQTAEEFELYPGAAEACAELRRAGFELIVVTNQPDVARGTQTAAAVNAMNALISNGLPVQEVMTCMHDDADGCDCRKPKPGLLLRAAKSRGLDLKASFMVGDRWSDIVAGQAAGCRAGILIERDYSRRERCRPDFIAGDVREAARIILEKGPPS